MLPVSAGEKWEERNGTSRSTEQIMGHQQTAEATDAWRGVTGHVSVQYWNTSFGLSYDHDNHLCTHTDQASIQERRWRGDRCDLVNKLQVDAEHPTRVAM